MEEIDTLEINGKNYGLIDTISDNKEVYNYFSNLEDANDIQILKDRLVNGEESFVSLDTEDEFNYALTLFFNKHKNDAL